MNIETILLLQQLPLIGRRIIQKIIANSNHNILDKKDLLEVLYDIQLRGLLVKKMPNIEDIKRAEEKANNIIKHCSIEGIKIVSIFDDLYPYNIRMISDPPVVLYIKGNKIRYNDLTNIAVVGTREPTKYGIKVAKRVGEILGEGNYGVVSGLAIGCDKCAHNGCLRVNGNTFAILPYSIFDINSKSNKELSELIIEKNGCLISEYSFYQEINKGNFIERNRIQSAISSGVIIIETNISGGTMHTAKYCIEQKRVLGCIDHPLDKRSEKSLGNQKLITEGVCSLSNKDTLKDFLNKVDKNNENLSKKNSVEIFKSNFAIEKQISMFQN